MGKMTNVKDGHSCQIYSDECICETCESDVNGYPTCKTCKKDKGMMV